MTPKQDLEMLQAEPEWEAIEFSPGDLESDESPFDSFLHLPETL